jgi:SlyX protein
MSEDRFIELETRLAHQDQTLFELNDAVTRQQQQITSLERLCRSLVERIASLDDSIRDRAAGDERPPHY